MTLGVGEAVRGAEHDGALARPVLRRALAALVLAAWVAWAVPSWMSSLHEVRPHEFAADVEAGRVTGYQVVTNVRSDPLSFRSLGAPWLADVPAADEQGRPLDGPPREIVYTVDGATRTRWVPQAVFLIGDRDAFMALVGSGARPFTAETSPPSRDWSAYFALLAACAALVGLVLVPPTRGTRPFWLLTSTLGMGLGIVAYAVAELGSPRALVPNRTPRLRWWHGLLVAVVGGLAVLVLRSAVT